MYELDEDTAVQRVAPGTHRWLVSGRWNIGPVPNGGYILAGVLGALSTELTFDDPVVATAYYLRPTEPGPAEISIESIKTGKRYATGEARLTQGGKERVRVLATFGALAVDGEGPRHVDGAPPALPPRDQCYVGRPAGVTPVIADRLDMALDPACVRWLEGERSEHAALRGWLRLADSRPWDLPAIAIAADGFPPPAFSVIDPGWVPTLELTLHFRSRPTTEWLRCRFVSRYIFDGHLEEDGEIWDDDGHLVALSRQMAILPRRP